MPSVTSVTDERGEYRLSPLPIGLYTVLFELTGFRDADLMGKDVVVAFGLGGFEDGKSPIAVALEWGVRQLGEKLELRSRAGQVKPITADIFPAYDDDGGLLVALSPR